MEESTLEKAFVMAWNGILENKEYFLPKWEDQEKSEDMLKTYRAKDFLMLTQGRRKSEKVDKDFTLRTLNYISVFEDGTLLVVFIDGTEIECKNEDS